jgi:uncharacterized OsmC-like protein
LLKAIAKGRHMTQTVETRIELVNNINIDAVKRSSEECKRSGGHRFIEKEIKGEFRFDGSPAFVAQLNSDYSKYTVTADEPKLLGGWGVHSTPLSYVLFGVMACYANTLAIQCALKGVELKKLRLTGRLFYDVGPLLTDSDSPLINKLKIEVEADKDIQDIIRLSWRKCPAVYAIEHPITTEIVQSKTEN